MDLTMTFTGICCFLQDFRRVVLLDARQPRPSRNNAMALIPSHYAYIRFPRSESWKGTESQLSIRLSEGFALRLSIR